MLLGCESISWGQTADLTGTVRDPSHSVVRRALLEVTEQSTGVTHRVTTNDNGIYVIPFLSPGAYELRVEATGFQPVRRTGVRAEVGQHVHLDFQLEVGRVEQVVTVEGSTPLVNLQDAAVGTVFNRQFVENLPLNGRSFQSLLQLVPGAVPNKIAGEAGQFSVNGQRPSSNYFTVDGVSANVGVNISSVPAQGGSGALPGFTVLGTTTNLVTVDALEEFKVQTSSFAPEYGRTPGAQVSLVTRSGTNDFHGVLSDYFRNDKLDANDWFANRNRLSRPPLRQNQFGGVFGGPVLLPGYEGRNHTFFFVSYEGLRLRQPQVSDTIVPTVAARQATPTGTRPLLDVFPLPTGVDLGNGMARYAASFSTPSTVDTVAARLDHHFNSKWSLFGRFQDSPSVTEPRRLAIPSNVQRNQIENRGLTLALTAILGPNVSSELRYNLSRTAGSAALRIETFGGATPLPDSVAFGSFGSSSDGLLIVNPLGGLGAFSLGTDANNRQWQNNIVENAAWTAGPHSLKFGVDWRRLNSTFGADQPSQYRPTYNFNGIAAIQAGQLLSGIINVKETVDLRFQNLSMYAQDTWHVNSRLTLTYGLRYELNPPPRGIDDANQPYTIDSLANIAAVAVAPRGTPLYRTTRTNFAPRAGGAWQIANKPGREFVLRAGWGMFYDLGTGVIANASGAFPFLRTKRLTASPFPLTSVQAAPLPIDAPPPYDLIRAFDPGIELPRTHQWNVSLEQALGANQVVTASYVGAQRRNLLRQSNISSPSPTISLLQLTTNGDRSDYHALQVQFQRRLSHGVQWLASYTWSKALDSGSTDTSFLPRFDRLDPRIDRGPADFDVRHSFTTAATWNLPGVRKDSPIRHMVNGWALDANAVLRSALPISVTGSRTLDFPGSFGARPDLLSGIPLYIDDPSVPGGLIINSSPVTGVPNQRGPFRFPTESRQGTLGRNVLRGFSFSQLDLAVRREFHLRERMRLQARFESFNVLNHPNFSDPNGNLGPVSAAGVISFNSTFGVSSSMLRNSLQGLSPLYQAGGPRSLQIALRLAF